AMENLHPIRVLFLSRDLCSSNPDETPRRSSAFETGNYNSLKPFENYFCENRKNYFVRAKINRSTTERLTYVHHQQLRFGHLLDGVAQAFAAQAGVFDY